MKQLKQHKYLFKALFFTLALSTSGYNISLAADAPIVHEDGQTHSYTEDVTINSASTNNPYSSNSSIVSYSNETIINMKKDLNINLTADQLVSNNSSSLNIAAFSFVGNINVDQNLTLNIDARDNIANTVYGIASTTENGINVKGNLAANFYGGVGDRITAVSTNVKVQGTSTINIYANKGTESAYGYGDTWDRRMALPVTISGGTHNINIQAENGTSVSGILKQSDTSISLLDNTTVNINIKNTTDGTIPWYNMSISGVSGTPLLESGSNLNIKMDLSTISTFDPNQLDLQTTNYKSYHTPAGIHIIPPSRSSIVPTAFLQKGSNTYIEVSGAPIWDTEDRYGRQFGSGSVVGLVAISQLQSDGNLTINVTSEKGVGIRLDDALGDYAQIALNGNTIINTNKGYAIMSESVVYGDYNNRYSYVLTNPHTSTISINQNGGNLVQITGELDHRTLRNSEYTLNLDRPDSFLLGSSMKSNDKEITYNNTVIKPKSKTDITLANSATWYMTGKNDNNKTGNSIVNKLTFTNQGYLNMTPSDTATAYTYEQLTVNELAGNNGKILMNTDLQASFDSKDVLADSDRIIINKYADKAQTLLNAASEGTHTVDVKDVSLLSKIASEGYLLLVEDHSQDGAAQFVGGELRKGGIFKYKPIITDQDPTGYINPPNDANNWYLTGFEKMSVTDETVINAGLAESRYIAYMNEQDTLIKRLGELRQHDKEKGLWVRIRGANNSVDGYGLTRNSYVSTHLGYDWKLKEKETSKAKRYLGIAFNHTNNNFDYAAGATGKGQSNVLTIYGTRLGDKGHYLDLVGKIGRMSNDYKQQDQHVEAKNWFYSLSAEYGRSIVRDKGWYYEPQIQFTYGHINGASYSSKETHISADGINSAILRAGILAGRKFNEDKPEKNGSYYAKLFYNHEFAGDVKATMTDVYGDRLDFKHSYSGSWLTVGLGTSLNLNSKTNLYLDVEKAFGGKVSGGWAWQGGVRWRF